MDGDRSARPRARPRMAVGPDPDPDTGIGRNTSSPAGTPCQPSTDRAGKT